ncbi:MAG: universal stress protein [Bacteroidales bacterium]|nr:universal stress protein [Bacteroidales bacterium]
MNNIILIPSDFSEVCGNAIDHGVEIARYFNYKLAVLHVINKHTKSYLKKEHLAYDAIDNKLSIIAKDIQREYNIEIDTISEEGSIFKTIAKVASKIKANLILLGTHGKVGIQNLTGSYALKVIQFSTVPVIIIQNRIFGDGYKNIVFPIHNTSEFKQKINWAIYIAKTFNSKIHIFQIKETNPDFIEKIYDINEYIKDTFNKNNLSYTFNEAENEGNYTEQLIDHAVIKRADMIIIMTNINEYQPAFLLGPWEEKLMFNRQQIPIMCINPGEIK